MAEKMPELHEDHDAMMIRAQGTARRLPVNEVPQTMALLACDAQRVWLAAECERLRERAEDAELIAWGMAQKQRDGDGGSIVLSHGERDFLGRPGKHADGEWWLFYYMDIPGPNMGSSKSLGTGPMPLLYEDARAILRAAKEKAAAQPTKEPGDVS